MKCPPTPEGREHVRIDTIGQPCRKCFTPVILRTRKPNHKPKEGRKYYYEAWLRCPNCRTDYFDPNMQVWVDDRPDEPTVDDLFKQRMERTD